MDYSRILDFRGYREEWSHELELLRQNNLLNEVGFINFARDRGINIQGVVTGDPGLLYRRGWLTSDGTDYQSSPLFHPFRLYPLLRILDTCEAAVAGTDLPSCQGDRFLGAIGRVLEFLPDTKAIEEIALGENRVADLGILLEPFYWPRITGQISYRNGMSSSEYQIELEAYRQKALYLVISLDPNLWLKIVLSLQEQAAGKDDNSDLYLLLRLGS